MPMKRKLSENINLSRKLLNLNNDSDEEFNYEVDNQGDDGGNGVNIMLDDGNISYDDDDMYDDDYFKYLEEDFFEDNSLLNETTLLNNKFSNKSLLLKAKPGTRKYEQIVTSTPALAAKILTKNFKVVNFECVFMEPSANEFVSFCIKTNSKKKSEK